MIQCNYLLSWQLSDGQIVKRWANIVSASKYDVGENGNNTLVLSSNNYAILIGFCNEGFELEGKRVFIDMNPINPIKVFKITRADDVLYNSGGMGSLLSYIADKKEFDPNKDNQELRICDYITPSPLPSVPNETAILRCKISGDEELQIGFPSTYSVTFTDKENGSCVNWNQVAFTWNIISDFEIEQNTEKNVIELLVEDESLSDEKFKLQIFVDNTLASEKIISISSIM